MPKDAKKLRKKVGTVILATVFSLIVMGGITISWLGREDPQDPSLAKLNFGDRMEKRMDTYIDKIRPKWADRVEKKMDPALKKAGWD